MSAPEKVILIFSIKNTQKNDYYTIKLTNEDKSLGDSSTFETEEIKSSKDGQEIIFQKRATYNYYFDKRQKLIINFIKKIHVGNDYQIKENERHTTLSSLVTSPNSKYERPLNKENVKKDILSIQLIKDNNNKPNEETKSLFEFLKSGMKISTFAAMDYSNGKNKESIDKRTNNYLNILMAIVSKMGIYSNNYTSFYFHGYGAQLKNTKNNSILYRSIFDIKIKEEDILKICKNDLDYYSVNIIPDRKVCLSSLIRKITKNIYELYKTNYYNVLFILARELTDDRDKQETIDAIIESSYLPLTIIIIGEGQNDFSGMKNLFGEKIKGASSGMDKNRNNIIFINYKNDFAENPSTMIEFCLRKINEQIIHFYNIIKCSPQQIKLNQVENVGEGFNKYRSSICLYESKIISASQIGNIGQINSMNDDDKDDVDYIKDDEKFDNKDKNVSLNKKKISAINPNVQIKKDKKTTKNGKNQDKKDGDMETPEGYVIPVQASIYSEIKDNPFSNNKNNQINQQSNLNNNNNKNNNQQKYNQGNCKVNNFINNNNNNQGNNNNATNKKNNNNQGNNNVTNKTNNNNQKYIITPGESVCPIINNPFQEDAERKKKYNTPTPEDPKDKKIIITPQDSICPAMNYNPYQKTPTPETPQPTEYIIPKQSYIQNGNNIENPYSKNYNINYNNYYNKNIEDEKNKINNMSGSSDYKSTNNSNNNDSLKDYNIIRNNYSIDTSHLK